MAERHYGEYEERRRGGGWLGRIIALLLGIILGILAAFGGIAFGGYYLIAQMKVKEISDTVKSVGNINYNLGDYLTDEYAEQTVLGIFKTLTGEGGVVDKFKKNEASLSTLNEISPQVKINIDKLADTLRDKVAIDLTEENVEELMTTPFNKLGSWLNGTIQPVVIGDVLDKVNHSMLRGNEVLMLLCYGEKNTDYIIDDEDKVVMLGDKTPTTVGDLMNNEQRKDLLNNLSLAAVVKAAMPDFNDTDPVISALLYGEKDVTYVIKDDGKVEMLPLSYVYNPETDEMTDPDGIVYKKDGEVWKNPDGITISAKTLKFARAAEEYAYYVYDNNGELIYSLKEAGENRFEPYKDGIVQLHSPRTIGSLMNNFDASEIAGGIVLGDLLNVTPQSDKLFLSLAYGSEGEDYTIENGKIVPVAGHKPTTVGDLMNDDGRSELLNKIKLGEAMNINGNSPLALIALAYGAEGADYTVDENGKIHSFYGNPDYPDAKAPVTLGDLVNGDTDALLNDIRLGDLLELNADSESVLIALAYGEEGVDYVIGENGKILPKEGSTPTTIADLMDGEKQKDLLDNILLDQFMDVDPEDPLRMTIMYGTEGKHYRLEEGKTGKDAVVMLPIVYSSESGVVYNDDGEPVQSERLANGVYKIILPASEEGKEPTIYYAKSFDGNKLHLYSAEECVSGEEILYKKTTLGELTNSTFTEKIENAKLGDIMSLDGDSDKILLSLAYGSGYTVDENNKVHSAEGKTPTTISDLMDSEKSADLFNDIELSQLFDVNSDNMLKALAYGNKGVHYEEDAEGNIVWNTDPETGKPYAPRTIGDLTGENASKIIDEICLGDALGYSPLDTGDTRDELMISLAYGNEGVEYTIQGGNLIWNTNPETGKPYAPRTIGDLKDGSEIFDSLRLPSIITDVDVNDRITMYVLYGVNGVHYRVTESGEAELLQKRFAVKEEGSTISIFDERGTLLEVTNTQKTGDDYRFNYKSETYLLKTSAPVLSEGVPVLTEEGVPYYYATDENGVALYYQPHTIGEFRKDNSLIADVTKDLTIGQIIGDTGDSKLLEKIGDWKVDDLSKQNKIMELKIGDIMEINETSPSMLIAMKDWSLNDFNDNDKLMSLKLSDILDDATLDGNFVLQHLKDSTLGSIADDMEALSITTVFENDVYTTDGDGNKIMHGAWKYMLTDPNGVKAPEAYTLKDLGDLMNNVTTNIQNATLNELTADGIITTDAGFLTQPVTYEVTVGEAPLTHTIHLADPEKYNNIDEIGKFTISQLLNYISDVLSNLS